MRSLFPLVAGILLACCALASHAQPTLPQQPTLTLEAVQTMMAAAEAHARANDWRVAIAIVDAGGHLLLFQRMDDVQRGSIDFALRKARTAALFRRPTKAFADRLAAGQLALLADPAVIHLEGGLPIVVDGVVVGAIGVSGVQAFQDAAIGQAGIDSLYE